MTSIEKGLKKYSVVLLFCHGLKMSHDCNSSGKHHSAGCAKKEVYILEFIPGVLLRTLIFNLNNTKEVFLYNIFGIVFSAVVYKWGFVAGRALHLGKTIVG